MTRIIITPYAIYSESENFSEKISPYSKLFIDNHEYILMDYQSTFKKTFEILKEHNIKNVVFFIERNWRSDGTALYYVSSRKPYAIVLDINSLKNIDNFKLIVGHELGHYINPYKKLLQKIGKIIDMDLFTDLVRIFSISAFYIFCLFLTIKLFDSSELSVMYLYLSGLYLLLGNYIYDFIDINKQYWEEYYCDKFGLEFAGTIQLEKTYLFNRFYNDYAFNYSFDSHPSDYNRILHLQNGEKNYRFFNYSVQKKVEKLKNLILGLFFYKNVISTMTKFKGNL